MSPLNQIADINIQIFLADLPIFSAGLPIFSADLPLFSAIFSKFDQYYVHICFEPLQKVF